MEKGKVLRNLEKLLNRDFEFINAGRITIVADTKEITTDLVKKICLELNINPLQISKADLIQFIQYFKGYNI
ncbi:hypothetical protein RN87_11880 (plasmid) [Fusobacterium hwasookii ChDC F174]|uniref:Uncharacterized protein n=1 Tax=Fusobacterium hwasookii ChDC F174 TaxID=1307442 RepID=A0A0S2ZR67_9FUSO|nr:hypothetical protein [Fusobacterium hwasookii]ALQ41254.1 hypothetical protein RN87_11880 [Fusobacterium hwasookii ChDC F174]